MLIYAVHEGRGTDVVRDGPEFGGRDPGKEREHLVDVFFCDSWNNGDKAYGMKRGFDDFCDANMNLVIQILLRKS